MRPMVRKPRPQLRPLLLGYRGSGLVVKDAVEQTVGDLEALARIEVLQLIKESGFVHGMKVLFGAGFSIGRHGALR
jgi:hypothetical protein